MHIPVRAKTLGGDCLEGGASSESILTTPRPHYPFDISFPHSVALYLVTLPRARCAIDLVIISPDDQFLDNGRLQ